MKTMHDIQPSCNNPHESNAREITFLWRLTATNLFHHGALHKNYGIVRFVETLFSWQCYLHKNNLCELKTIMKMHLYHHENIFMRVHNNTTRVT